MISIIMCSAKPERLKAAIEMYLAAMEGEPCEIIPISNPPSIAEGYLQGISRARGDILVFSHDDVELLSPDFPARLKGHLATQDLIGVVGTTRLINAIWTSAGPPHIYGQIAMRNPQAYVVNIYCTPTRLVENIQAVDGLFMAARRSVFDKVSFDAALFNGFHLYDLDLSFAAYNAGLKVGVACDINLLHASEGDFFTSTWQNYWARFYNKWRTKLCDAPRPRAQWAMVEVQNLAQALAVMTPPHWPPLSNKQ